MTDFSVLENGQDRDPKKSNKYTEKFVQAVQDKKLNVLGYSEKNGAEAIYDKLCKAIIYAAETVLPKRRSKRGIKRKVSTNTKNYMTKGSPKLTAPTTTKRHTRKKSKRMDWKISWTG